MVMGGVVNFLRKFFAKEAPKEETIFLRSLPAWLKKHTEGFYKDIDLKLNESMGLLDKLKTEVKEHLSKLHEAKLKNTNIPERARQMMEGNRESYIKRIDGFFKSLDPDIKSIDSAEEFCKKTRKVIDSLNSQTSKSYYVLQEFLANESRDIALDIKKLLTIIEGMESILSQDAIKWIVNVESDIRSLNESMDAKKNTSSQIHKLKEKVKELKLDLTGFETKVKEMQATPEYTDYLETVKAVKSGNEKLLKMKTFFHTEFLALEHAFKKYQRIALDETLVKKYIDDPFGALKEDNDLEILKTLDSVKKNIGSLQLNSKKEEKTLKALTGMDKTFFDKVKTEINNTSIALTSAEAKLNKITVNSKVDQVKAQIIETKKKVDDVESQIVSKSQDVKKISTEKIITRIKSAVEEHLNIILEVKR